MKNNGISAAVPTVGPAAERMASNKELVTLEGVVRGEGYEVSCKIRAVKVSLPGAPGISETADWSMIDTSEPLPDGEYEVLADGKQVPVRYINGQWSSRQRI